MIGKNVGEGRGVILLKKDFSILTGERVSVPVQAVGKRWRICVSSA